MKFGVALGALNPHFHLDAVDAAERLGFESVWLPEHLVFPVEMTRSPRAGEEHPPVPSTTPIFDAFTYLAFIAARTQRVRVGTHVYNVGLRHPFVSARAVATLDRLSGGRFEYGVGAGWLEQEWVAAELDFGSRGRRVDEILEISQRLWTEATIEHHGEFFDFDAVAFEPKPMQSPWPPILVGGESEAALRRASRWGDGWIGMSHTLTTAASPIERLQTLRQAAGRTDAGFQVCLGTSVSSRAEVERWEALGVTRLIVSPWRRSPEAVEALERFAELVF